jgi:sugar/nucleoside kinase (ribokinase family)
VVARPVSAYPKPGEFMPVDEISLYTGGGAANTAVDLIKLGVSSALVGRVGTDGIGDFVVNALSQQGVDVTGVRRDSKLGTDCGIVLTTPDGERSFIGAIGANTAVSASDIDWDELSKSKILHIGCAMMLPGFDSQPVPVLKRAQELGLTISVDTACGSNGHWWETLSPYLPYTDLFLPSLKEAELLTGKSDPQEMARIFLDAGAKVVAVKLGEQGCFVCSRKEEYHVPPFRVSCIDATGAGDAFAAGFLAGWLQGLPLQETARLANAAGAMATTAMGAAAGIAGLDGIKALLSTAR